MTTTLITGATRGLGREAARRLVLAGHEVHLGARDLARGEQVAAEVGAVAIALDVVDEASIVAAVDRVRAEVGSLDVLVNNAGIAGEQRRPDQATIADLRRVLETNVVGACPRWRVNSVTPGLTATDLAPAAAAGHPVEEGAEILVRMALVGPGGPTGTFVDVDGPVPW